MARVTISLSDLARNQLIADRLQVQVGGNSDDSASMRTDSETGEISSFYLSPEQIIKKVYFES
jgi:hypothetical protein